MKSIFLLLSLFSLLTQNKLYQVFSLCRHGARYHERDMWDGNETKPFWAEITGVGMRQHFKLGKILRKEYIDDLKFLSHTYQKSQIEAYTTYTNRTAASLLSQFYGLYPIPQGPRLPQVDRKWHLPPYSNKTDNDEQNYALPLGHQIIPIRQTENILLRSCPNFVKYFKENLDRMSDVLQQMRVYYTPFMKNISHYFNFTLNTTTLEQMFYAYDASIVDNHLGRPWPKGFSMDDFRNLQHLATWHYTTMWTGKNTIMSCSGKINRMLSLFDLRTRVPNTTGIKWSFLVGHEGDMLATQIALNITSADCIEELYRKGTTSAYACEIEGLDFASNIIIELHSNDEKSFYVKVRSNGNYVKPIGQNSLQVPYSDFKNNMKKFITSNLTDFCGRTLHDPFEKGLDSAFSL